MPAEIEINPDEFFLQIGDAVVECLDQEAYFDTIPGITERLGDMDNAIETVMNKLGICYVVETPFASATKPNVPAIQFDDVPITLTFWEDTVMNRNAANANGRTFTGAALIAAWLLHQYVPRTSGGVALCNMLYCDTPTMVDLRGAIDRQAFPNVQGVQLRLKCSAGFDYDPQASLLDGNNQSLLDGMGIKLTTPRPFSRTP